VEEAQRAVEALDQELKQRAAEERLNLEKVHHI